MAVSRQVEIPYYRGIVRKYGRGFSAVARIIGRTAIQILRKYIVPATKCVGSGFLELRATEATKVVSGRKNFETPVKCVGRHILRKKLGSSSRKKTASKVFPTKNAK